MEKELLPPIYNDKELVNSLRQKLGREPMLDELIEAKLGRKMTTKMTQEELNAWSELKRMNERFKELQLAGATNGNTYNQLLNAFIEMIRRPDAYVNNGDGTYSVIVDTVNGREEVIKINKSKVAGGKHTGVISLRNFTGSLPSWVCDRFIHYAERGLNNARGSSKDKESLEKELFGSALD